MSIDFDIGAFENSRRVMYDARASQGSWIVFIAVCPECAKFVKADTSYQFNESKGITGANATCKQHGRVEMPFDGWYTDADLRGEDY